MTTYRIAHRPPDNEAGAPLHDLTMVYPDDVYSRWDLYHGGDDPETRRSIRKAHGKPEALVKVYRSVPKGVTEIHPGDWVSLSRDYAAQCGFHATDPKLDDPVISAYAPAKTLHNDGNSLQEFGYNGPATLQATEG
jgi:hypothetical protein